jgi:hypothetical protein
MIALDMHLAYIRAAFHTCYYCSIVSDHLEELQRKCIRHTRKPLSKAALDEMKVAEAEKVEKANEGDKEKEPEKEHPPRERPNENKDWRRNGACCIYSIVLC